MHAGTPSRQRERPASLPVPRRPEAARRGPSSANLGDDVPTRRARLPPRPRRAPPGSLARPPPGVPPAPVRAAREDALDRLPGLAPPGRRAPRHAADPLRRARGAARRRRASLRPPAPRLRSTPELHRRRAAPPLAGRPLPSLAGRRVRGSGRGARDLGHRPVGPALAPDHPRRSGRSRAAARPAGDPRHGPRSPLRRARLGHGGGALRRAAHRRAARRLRVALAPVPLRLRARRDHGAPPGGDARVVAAVGRGRSRPDPHARPADAEAPDDHHPRRAPRRDGGGPPARLRRADRPRPLPAPQVRVPGRRAEAPLPDAGARGDAGAGRGLGLLAGRRAGWLGVVPAMEQPGAVGPGRGHLRDGEPHRRARGGRRRGGAEQALRGARLRRGRSRATCPR